MRSRGSAVALALALALAALLLAPGAVAQERRPLVGVVRGAAGKLIQLRLQFLTATSDSTPFDFQAGRDGTTVVVR